MEYQEQMTMTKEVSYKLSEEEYRDLENKLGLLRYSLEEERKRLRDIPSRDKTRSEIIAENRVEYDLNLTRAIGYLLGM